MIPNLLTVFYLSLAVHIGLTHQFHQFWGWLIIALFFFAQAILLRWFSNRSNFHYRWSLLLFTQYPVFLLIFWNRFWPVLNLTWMTGAVVALMICCSLYAFRRKINPETLLTLFFATLPAFIVLIPASHFGLILTSNEWRLMAEEGQIMGWITKVLHGEVPFRDAIVTRGPVIIYSTAAVLKVFEETLLMKRVWFELFNLLMAYAGYYFCKTFMSSKPLRWFVFILMILIHDFTYRTGFALLALALFWLSISKQSFRWAAVSGLSLAIAFLSSVEAGTAAAVTMIVISIAGFLFQADQRLIFRKVTTGWIAGGALIILPLALLLMIRGELGETLDSILVYPKYAMLGYAASPYPNLLKMIRLDLINQSYWFPFTQRIFALWYLPVLI
jgi:hypothetical protein